MGVTFSVFGLYTDQYLTWNRNLKMYKNSVFLKSNISSVLIILLFNSLEYVLFQKQFTYLVTIRVPRISLPVKLIIAISFIAIIFLRLKW